MKLLTSKRYAGFHGSVRPVVSHEQGLVNINFKSTANFQTSYPAALQLSPSDCDALIEQMILCRDIAKAEQVSLSQNVLPFGGGVAA